jgi:hypothetical protein
MSAPGPAPTTFSRGANDAERLWLLGGLYTSWRYLYTSWR